MRIPAFLLNQQITVETYRGQSAYGPVFDAPATVKCRTEDGTDRIIDASGAEIVSVGRVCAAPEAAELLPIGSRVTLDGNKRVVVRREIKMGLAAPTHVEVYLK